MEVPQDTRFTKTHEWVRGRADRVRVGISDFAQQQLSDITFVELPGVGDRVEREEEVAVVESVKAASDIYAPLSGTVTRVNEALNDKPELINEDPYGEGWLFEVEPGRPEEMDELMTPEAYERELPEAD
jgi:glycine cleavage system H protein